MKIKEIFIDSFHQKSIHLQEKQEESLPSFLVTCYQEAKKSPKKTLKKLLGKKEEYVGFDSFNHLLTYLYIRTKQIKKAEALIEAIYRKDPLHLIARINFADQCLRKNKVEEIPLIFKGIYDLRDLYPQRKAFTYTEYRSFMTLMGFYHLAIGNKEFATCYHALAHQIDSHHPAVQLLGKKLYHIPLLKRLWRRFTGGREDQKEQSPQ